MTTKLNLHVGALTTKGGTDAALQRVLQEVAPKIEEASGGDIQLRVINRGTVTMPGWGTQGEVGSEVLHKALERMTGDQVGVKDIQNIGILVADRFEPAPNFFGLMFDDAFQPTGSSPWKRTPREGCAVFLGGIEDGRAPENRLDETVFTAVHELAHVFNIQHGQRPSYMLQSARFGQVPLDEARFSQGECNLLAQCSHSDHIRPGGSAFDNLADLANAPGPTRPARAPSPTLTLKLDRSRFFAFEPVELDVELANPTRSRVAVPDALDAGYASFRLWIEEPDGSRRFLRSPRHYCSPRGQLEMLPGTTFNRDISLFGESGGYTFRRAGIHRVWATFEVAPGRTVTSNEVQAVILARSPGDPFFQHASGLLGQGQVARLLYYRRMSTARWKALTALQEFCATYPRHPSSAMVQYCVGRALARAVIDRPSRAAGKATMTQQARENLKAAAGRKQLGQHRQQRAEQSLAALDALG